MNRIVGNCVSQEVLACQRGLLNVGNCVSQEVLACQRGLLNAVSQLDMMVVGIDVGRHCNGLCLMDDFVLAFFVFC